MQTTSGLDNTLKVTRLGHSLVHLVNLGAELRQREIGLHVIEQGIDTGTAEGRAMFGMLAVLAEFSANSSWPTPTTAWPPPGPAVASVGASPS